MRYFFITGTSRGLGKAFAEHFLMQENTHVTGISRTQTIQHAHYKHWNLDLSDMMETERFLQIAFKSLENPTQIVLINNAGMLGNIAYVGDFQSKILEQTVNLNLASPILLTNHFLKKYQTTHCPKLILNISSGAGRKSYDGWATYCATKSAMDMFSEVMAMEQKLRASDVRIFSVAPGVVDTEMQAQIRENSNLLNFSNFERFLALKDEHQLASPTEVAQKIALIIDQPEGFGQTILDVRKF